MKQSQDLGTEPIGKLLMKQAIPASIGFLVMFVYSIVDTIFVGRWVGSLGIGAITVVMPITFLVGAIGMAIGIGGSSIISRALGADEEGKAHLTFGNMAVLAIGLSTIFVVLGYIFADEVIIAFGGKGDILEPARQYFHIVMAGIPFLAWAMMTNNVIRAQGYPKVAMFVLIIPAISNLILDPIFIAVLDWGLDGAAWATFISYIFSALLTFWFFLSGRSEIKLQVKNLRLKAPIVKEIGAIGGVSMARQGTISLLSIVLNHTLFSYGDELSIAAYGIVNRVIMFANFPVIGIMQGFLPICGFNYGAKKFGRVRESIVTSIKAGTGVALVIFAIILIFPHSLVSIFSEEAELLAAAEHALVLIMLATPTITIQLIGSHYFQAIGKAMPALWLSLMKQGFFLIPLLFIFPPIFGMDGIWYAFPVADVLAAATSIWVLRGALKKLGVAQTHATESS